MLKWLFGRNKNKIPDNLMDLIDRDALQIIRILQEAGFETYLVGGGVRDLLLKQKPKDFDIATKASPQQVKSLIKRSFIIGKRFRIVVAKRKATQTEFQNELFPIFHGRPLEKEFQITTFRRDP